MDAPEHDPDTVLAAAAPDVDPAAWNRALTHARRAELRLPAEGAMLIACAHPDDESIGAGRLIAAAVANGCRVGAIVATAGEACFGGTSVDPAWTAAVRLDEWRAALRELGAEPITTPRFPDGRLGEHFDELVELIVDSASAHGATAIWSTWRHDPHPDHEAAGEAAARAAERLGVEFVEFPVWTMSWRTPGEVADRGAEVQHLPLAADATVCRAAALAHYRSQLEPLRAGWPPVVPQRMLDRHDRQYLVVERDDAAGDDR